VEISEGEGQMKCTIEGCPGGYELRSIVHTVRHKGEVIVIDHVPAEVCTVCGDVLLKPDTVRRIEALLHSRPRAAKTAPVYEFA
jgi:YgiT-type zinc finger domain-containing protein